MGGQPDMDKLIAEIQKLSAKIDEQEEARKRQETFAATVGDRKHPRSRFVLSVKDWVMYQRFVQIVLWLLGKNIIIF
ncbi:Neuronal acetylcholine receptor subunit alpha-7 [Bienertia sinuspersici]